MSKIEIKNGKLWHEAETPNKAADRYKALFEDGYGILVEVVTWYHLKLRKEESDTVYNWYNTTGSLVADHYGRFKSLGKIKEAEEVAILICKRENI